MLQHFVSFILSQCEMFFFFSGSGSNKPKSNNDNDICKFSAFVAAIKITYLLNTEYSRCREE